ncbi:DUF6345 domain-containing protein [Sorangium sp. So ce1504]|uniref:DUF6345 domain-containing protein n=1 Tax=Sorangium sp. So ce1504 TaxID=3133337 RepID=UPI003F63ECBA
MATIGLESIRWYDQYRQNNDTLLKDGTVVPAPIPKGVGGWTDLDYSYNITNGFYEVMTGAGETCPFYFGGGDVWETDIKDSAKRGNDVTYADGVDLWFFAGHSYIRQPDGAGAHIVFNSKFDNWSSPSRTWHLGDNWDCDWIALWSCETLKFRETGWKNYSNIFGRLHIMLGAWGEMVSCADFANVGRGFAENLLDGDPVSAAWLDAMGIENKPAAFSAERAETWRRGDPDYNATTLSNDHYWGRGITFPDTPPSEIAWLHYRWLERT